MVCSSSTPSQDVTLCLHSTDMAKRSAWQTCDVCSEVSSLFTKLICYPADVEEEDNVMLEKFAVTIYDRSSYLMMHDWNCLPGSRDPTKLFHQLNQPLFSISDVLHTRYHVYVDRLCCASLKRRVLLNGDGNKKETAGTSYGVHPHQLLRVPYS